MRSILLSLIVFFAAVSCGSQESDGTSANPAENGPPATMTTASGEVLLVGSCCNGGCGVPEGYCCNEAHCGGRCDESLPIWDTVAAAPKEPTKPE